VPGALLCIALLHGVAAADPARPPSKRSLGVFVGVPQLIAPTLEVRSDRDFRFQVGASDLLLIASTSGRVLIGDPTPGVKPYGFLGGGILDVREGEGGGAIGTSGFFWFGADFEFTSAGCRFSSMWVRPAGGTGAKDSTGRFRQARSAS